MTSITNIIKSLTHKRQEIIKDLGRDGICALAYDNLDLDFKVKEPTLENLGSFSSITTGTFIPLGYGTTLEDLRFSRELWEKNSLNPHGPKDTTPSQPPLHKYLLMQLRNALPQVESAMLWVIKSIVVDECLPPEYRALLGPLPSSMNIPIEKSIQQPAHAMHIKASSTDGNVEIVENLERQLGTSKEWYDQYIHLCHGDLGTQECHDVTTFFHSIDHTS